MARIIVDGRSYDAEAGENLLRTCLSLGLDLPYFCWHPAMGAVGACRQCAVKQFRGPDDEHGQIVMACMTEVSDGMRIAIAEDEAVAFRASVIEWLMTNHPHDCPVCPEGGECHLQDMTLMSGHIYRRYRFAKRTHRNQYLGPFLTHEMNRCIACYRCVRFYRDYAGGRDFDVFSIHRDVYFGRSEDGILENEFSGNLAEVCPTGVFDDKTLTEVYNRKWDLRGTPSVCVHCGLGCNTFPNGRYGQVKRILNRYNGQINGYFLCDRGRFGHGFTRSPQRALRPLLRNAKEGDAAPVGKAEALAHLASLVRGGKAIGIGSPRASVEANVALRELVGAESFHLGLSGTEQALIRLILDIMRNGRTPVASLKDAEQADAILVLGEDLPSTAPRLALCLRQAVRQKSFRIADDLKIPRWMDAAVREAGGSAFSPLFLATPDATRLDDVATDCFRATPDDIARLGFAIAHALDPKAPSVAGLSTEMAGRADAIAQALKAAEQPLIVAGVGCGSRAIIEAASNVAWALHRQNQAAQFLPIVGECNSLGLGLIGGGTLADAAEAIQSGRADALIVLENDLYRRNERPAIDRLLEKTAHLVVIDHLMHGTAERAELILPAGTLAEAEGTFVNNEGRAQRFFSLDPPTGEVEESWRWLGDALQAMGRMQAPWVSLDDAIAACVEALPDLAPIRQAAPDADFRIEGSKIARQPHRYSGRTAVDAAWTIREPTPPKDPDAPLSYTMEGYYGPMPSALYPFFWAPSWNSVQALNKFQEEVGGPLRGGDPGIRLIPPASGNGRPYFADVPRPFSRRSGQWQVVPLYEIFGSEELSRLSPAVAERVPPAYLALNPKDAAGLTAGQAGEPMVTLSLGLATYRLPLKLREELPLGAAGLVVGFPETQGAQLPDWGRITIAAGATSP